MAENAGERPKKKRLTQSSPSQRLLAASPPRPPRKRGVLALAAFVVLGGLGLAAWLVLRPSASGGGRASLAAFAPARTVLWLEADQTGHTWESWKATKGFADLRASSSWAGLEKEWRRLGETSFVKELGLPLDERLALLLAGQRVAAGLAFHGADPGVLLATELDTAGIAQDLALQGDWGKLWEKLSRALGAREGGQAYKGVAVSDVLLGNATLHVAFQRPYVIASDSLEVLHDAIDAQKGEAPSLAGSKVFQRETGVLPPGAAFAFVDVATARKPEEASRAVTAALHVLGATTTLEASHLVPLAEELAPIDALALGIELAGGDLLAPSVVATRSEREVWKDARAIVPPGLLPSDPMIAGETRGLAVALSALLEGGPGRTLADSEAARWFQEALKHPLASGLVQGSEDRDVSFEVELLGRFLASEARELAGDEAAWAVDLRADAPPPRDVEATFFLRARPATRVLALVLGGFALANDGHEAWARATTATETARAAPPVFRAGTRGDHRVFGIEDSELALYWGLAAGALVVSTDRGELEFAIDRAERPGAAVSGAAVEAIARCPEGWCAAARLDAERYFPAARKIAERRGTGDPLDAWQASSGGSKEIVYAAYAGADRVTLRTWQTLAPGQPVLAKNAEGAPRALKQLPEESIGSLSLDLDAKLLWDTFLAGMRATSGEKGVKGFLDDARQVLGREVEDALVKPLGTSHAVSIVPQVSLVPKEFGPKAARRVLAVPALVAAIELADPAGYEDAVLQVVKKTIASLNDDLTEQARRTGDTRSSRLASLAVEKNGASRIYRYVAPAEDSIEETFGLGFQPCFAVQGSWLFVATSKPALLRAMAASGGKNLGTSSERSALLELVPKKGGSFGHLSFPHLLYQLECDAEPMSRTLAPAPASLGRRPAPPPPIAFSRKMTSHELEAALQAYDERSRAYQKESAAWRARLDEWREKNAPENAATLGRIFKSLYALGGIATSSTVGDGVIETTTVWKLGAPGER